MVGRVDRTAAPHSGLPSRCQAVARTMLPRQGRSGGAKESLCTGVFGRRYRARACRVRHAFGPCSGCAVPRGGRGGVRRALRGPWPGGGEVAEGDKGSAPSRRHAPGDRFAPPTPFRTTIFGQNLRHAPRLARYRPTTGHPAPGTGRSARGPRPVRPRTPHPPPTERPGALPTATAKRTPSRPTRRARPAHATVREAGLAPRTGPPPAGNEVAVSPSPLDPVQRADPRTSHGSAPVPQRPARTHGRTATRTRSTCQTPYTRLDLKPAIRDIGT